MTIERMLTEEEPAADAGRAGAAGGRHRVWCSAFPAATPAGSSRACASTRTRVRMVLVREESLAGVMAEVYGRLTRRPGVMIGQGPWVLGNGLIGTIEAYPVELADAAADRFQRRAAVSSARALPAGDRRLRQLGRAPRVQRRHQAGHAGARRRSPRCRRRSSRSSMRSPGSPVRSRCCSPWIRWPARCSPTRSRCSTRPATICRPPPPPADAAHVAAAAAGAARGASEPVMIAGNGVRIAQAYDAAAPRSPRRPDCRWRRRRPARAASPRPIRLALGVFGTFGTDGGQCLHRRGRSRAGDRLEARRRATRPGRTATCSTRRGRPSCRSTSSRATRRGHFPAEHVLIGDAAHGPAAS